MWHLLKDMRKKDKGLAFLAVLLIAGQVFLDLKLPDYTKEITVLISSESNAISDYLLSGGKMLACALGSALLAVIVGYLAAKIAADFSHNVRGTGMFYLYPEDIMYSLLHEHRYPEYPLMP